MRTYTESIISEDFYTKVQMGLVPGMSIIEKFGHNDAVGTTLEAVSNAGVYRMPLAATSLEILSSDAADNIAGAGAQKVKIIGLDSSWNEIEQIVDMNGITPVAIPIDLFRQNDARVHKSGTYGSVTANSHVGTLTIREAGAGQTWSIINGSTTKPHAQTQIGSHTIPAGKTGFLLNTFVHVDSGKTVNVLLYRRLNADVIAAPFDSFRLLSEVRGITGTRNLTLRGARVFPGKSDMVWLAQVPVTTADCSIDFEILLVDNDLIPDQNLPIG